MRIRDKVISESHKCIDLVLVDGSLVDFFFFIANVFLILLSIVRDLKLYIY